MQDKEGKTFNISLHGISAIVVLLSELLDVDGSKRVDIRDLLKGAINSIPAREINADHYGSLFPYASKESGEIIRSRLAWCYGG